MTITAGTQITLESTGADPDGSSFCYETIDKDNVVHRHCLKVGHKFYSPEGYSTAGAVLRYKVWRTGENKFLLQVSDGYSRSFADFSVNVSEAANVNPVAYIDYPKAGASYPAGTPVVFAPAARIRVVDEAALTEFGSAEVTGVDSSDPDGQDTIAGYRWSFTGPNGYTDLSNQVFVEASPRYLFSTWYPGTYTVFLTVVDKWGALGTTSRAFTVKPSDGTIRANVISSSFTVGNRYINYDLDSGIKKYKT